MKPNQPGQISPTWPLNWMMGLGHFSKLNQQDKKLAELIIELNQQAKKLAELIIELNQQAKKLAELIIELNQQAKLAQHGRRIGWALVIFEVSQQDKLAWPGGQLSS
jgi:hypothetical protein